MRGDERKDRMLCCCFQLETEFGQNERRRLGVVLLTHREDSAQQTRARFTVAVFVDFFIQLVFVNTVTSDEQRVYRRSVRTCNVVLE